MLPFCSWLRHVLLSLSHSLPLLVLCISSAFLFSQLWQLLSPLLPGFLCSQISSSHRCMAALHPKPRDPSAFHCSNGTLMLLCFLFVGLQGKNKCAVACCPEKRRWVIDSESSLHSRGLTRWSCTGELCHCGAPAEQLLYPALLPDCHGLWRFPCPQTVHQECFQFQFVPFIQREANRRSLFCVESAHQG